MRILKKTPRSHGLNEPILHRDNHGRPSTRRQFISAGLMTGPAVVAAGGLLTMLANPRRARALAPDMLNLKQNVPGACNIQAGAGKIPFICFDLAGGANLNGSEILIGGRGGQLDFLSTAGYAKLGLPGNMVPNAPNAGSTTNNFIDTQFGAAWHSDGAILRGMIERTAVGTRALTNGVSIAARSENDTGNNPHNPMYGILRAGARGELLTLIGSQATDSGGNSMAPIAMIDPANRPTKVDRASDVTGLVDTGDPTVLPRDVSVDVLESMVRLSGGTTVGGVGTNGKLGKLNMGASFADGSIQNALRCAYLKSAYLADTFGDPSALNPDKDPDIVDATATRASGIFGLTEYQGDGEFRKAAAVMKMVVNGYAGAGTITMGGFDYHTGNRSDGEGRNFRAGRCIGACLEYAARKGKPLMIYVFSDGSLNAMSTIDSSTGGRGKFGWQGDNQSVAASFILVYSPTARPQVLTADAAGGLGKQIGYYRADGSIETASHPGANAVNLLVETVILNYMALHGEQGNFSALFPSNGLGSSALRDSITAFAPIVSGPI